MDNLTELKKAFVRAGGKLESAITQRKLAAADLRAKQEAEHVSAPPNAKAAEWIKKALGYLAVAFFIVVLIGGVGALLIIIPAAEFAAVQEGLNVITPNKTFITVLTTSAVFVGILVLMFLGHVYADALPEEKPSRTLRGGVAKWLVWAGWEDSKKWLDKPLNKVEHDYLMIYTALNLSKTAVILTSLMGRLKGVIEKHGDKSFIHSLGPFVREITGQELIGVVTSFLLLFGILKMLDVGVLFAYTAFKNSAGQLDLAEVKTTNFLDEYSRLSELYQAQVLSDLTMQLELKAEMEPPESLNS